MTVANKPRLLVLVGPTAVGKTQLSLMIAEQWGCEIISGDSMQIYKGMNIGTAKIESEETRGIPHHMLDIIQPDEVFSVADYQLKAGQYISDIHGRGELPFIVGGTGLYIESVCYDFQFANHGSDESFREDQRMFYEQHGEEALHERLRTLDPDAADRIHPNDTRRTIRALEVIHLSGKLFSEQSKRSNPESSYDLCIIGLTMERSLLYKRIEERIDQMLEHGFVDEVIMLLKKGYSRNLVSMQGLGYKEISGYLSGEDDWESTIDKLKQNSRRYAKRQLSWFRHMHEIQWVNISDPLKIAIHLETINDIITTKFQHDHL